MLELEEKKLPGATVANNRLLSPPEVQEILGIGKNAFYGLMGRKNDAIPSIRVGRYRRFRLDQLLWWIDKHQE